MRHWLRLTILTLLILALAACGGSSDTPAGAGDAPPATDAVLATEAPTAVPSPTPEATPTTEPTATATDTPVAAVEPTPTPEPEPTATATAEPTAATGTGEMSGLCGNPFFPIVEGASWTYNTTGAGASTYTRSVAEVRDNGFTLTHTTSGSPTVLRIDYECTEDGLVSGTLGGLPAAGGFSLKVTGFSGTNFPPADQWQVGNTWTASYTVEGNGSVGGIEANASGTIDLSYEIVGQESVDVPAGTFDAFKVDSTLTEQLTMSAAGATVPMDLAINSTDWYAKDVGQVKSQTYGDFASTTELVSVEGL
jgi:hypothetical protein